MALPKNYVQQLVDLAPALSLEECHEYFDIVDCTEEELKTFKKAYINAKYELRMEAIRALRNDLMNGKTKTTSSLAILLRFSDEWSELSAEPGNKQFVAKIQIGE